MKLTEKQLLVLTLVIPAVLAVILGAVGFFVFNKDKSNLDKQISDIGKKISDEKNRLNEMGKMEDRLKVLRGEREALQALLPTKDEASYENFIDTLTRFCREAGVKLSSVTAEEGKGGPPSTGQQAAFSRISYSLKMQGDFFQVMNYIHLLETYQRFIKVDNFNVRPDGAITTDTPTKFSMDLKVTSYVYDPAKK